MCDVVHSLGKVLKNLIWRQATSGIAVGMHTPRRHPVDSAPWTNSFQRPTPWWSKGDSNCRSLSRNESVSLTEREVPQRRKELSRARRLPGGDRQFESPSLPQ